MNIIIGPNGSGKTNFVDFLSALLQFDTKPKSMLPYSARFVLESARGEAEVRERYEITANDIERGVEGKAIISLLENNKEENLYSRDGIFCVPTPLEDIPVIIKIPFTIPKAFEAYMLSDLGQVQVTKDKFTVNVLRPLFTSNIRLVLYSMRANEKNYKELDTNEILTIKPSLLDNLRKFSPIQNLRLRPGAYLNITETEINFNYLMLEFYVNNTWLTWAELSL